MHCWRARAVINAGAQIHREEHSLSYFDDVHVNEFIQANLATLSRTTSDFPLFFSFVSHCNCLSGIYDFIPPCSRTFPRSNTLQWSSLCTGLIGMWMTSKKSFPILRQLLYRGLFLDQLQSTSHFTHFSKVMNHSPYKLVSPPVFCRFQRELREFRRTRISQRHWAVHSQSRGRYRNLTLVRSNHSNYYRELKGLVIFPLCFMFHSFLSRTLFCFTRILQ